MKITYKSNIGLCVCKGDWEGAQWTLCGYPNKDIVGRHTTVYEFEDIIKHQLDCRGIEFDSESGEFYAYAKSSKRLISLLTKIEKYFEKCNAMYSTK